MNETIVIECPRCKGRVQINRSCEKITCIYCHAEMQIKQPNMDVATANREYEVKMAIASRFEELYFIGGKTFDQVKSAYDDVGEAGAKRAEYWLAKARFYAKGMSNELSNGEIELSDENMVIDQYTELMDTALKHGGVKAEIEVEKKETIAKISETFEKEAKMDRKTYRMTSGILAIPFLVLLLVFYLDDQSDGTLAADGDRNWPVVNAEDGERNWPDEYLVRWENSLEEVRIDFERTQYSNFVETEYFTHFMDVGSPNDEFTNMEMEFTENYDAPEIQIGDFSIEFDTQHPTFALHFVEYFDGLSLVALAGYDIFDIAGIFATNYTVPVYYWRDYGMIRFTLNGIVFQVDTFTESGATVIVGSLLEAAEVNYY